MANRSRLLGLLSLLLLVALAAPAARASPTKSHGPARLHGRGSAQDEKKTSDQCNFTGQCPPCSPLNLRSAVSVQCCWPRGQGYGSPFDSPGFCLCAPPDRFDYSQCLGGFWTS